MCIQKDMAELIRRANCMIKKFEKGDFVQAGDIVSMAYIKLFEEEMIYEKIIFLKIMYSCVRNYYRKTLAINHPVALDGTIYQRFSKIKTCSCCKETLSTSAFNIYYNSVFEGWYLSTECKICSSERSKKHNKDKPELFKARMQRFNDKRREKISKERQELTDAYVIKMILKHGLSVEWLKEHPEYIEKERRILKRKQLKKRS